MKTKSLSIGSQRTKFNSNRANKQNLVSINRIWPSMQKIKTQNQNQRMASGTNLKRQDADGQKIQVTDNFAYPIKNYSEQQSNLLVGANKSSANKQKVVHKVPPKTQSSKSLFSRELKSRKYLEQIPLMPNQAQNKSSPKQASKQKSIKVQQNKEKDISKKQPVFEKGQQQKQKKYYPINLKDNQLNESQRQRIRDLKFTVENSDKITVDGTIPIKLVLVGDGSVGKTSMLISYTTDNFPTDYTPTIFNNYVADVKMGANMVKLWLWDTAGQQQYAQLRLISYQKADIFFICFSMIDQSSFYNALNKWFPEVHQECPRAVKIFVGTKSDLHSEYLEDSTNTHKAIPLDYIRSKCESKNCLFMPCSGLNQKGLNQVFSKAMNIIIERTKAKKQSSSCLII